MAGIATKAPTQEAPVQERDVRRLVRIASLLDAGVEVRSALATELIRSLRSNPVGLEPLFAKLEEEDPGAGEATEARRAAAAGGPAAAIKHLQAYLQRITVEEVPFAARRLWRRHAG